MIDIHSHIIHDVDDGPKTIEESIALVTESYNQGVRKIVSTSHRRKGMFEEPETKIYQNFLLLKQEVEKRFDDLELFFGGELYFTSDILTKLENKEVPTMSDTRFALVEFSMTTSWKEIYAALQKILMLGVTPIVAHIERYNALEFNNKRVKEMIDMGCYTQVNSAHVLKPKLIGDKAKIFKKRVQFFLDENLVHCVSSDMHNLDKRRPYMKQAYKIVEKEYGIRRARDLFEANASVLLENEYL